MDVFCIQESRGSWAHVIKHCRLISRDYWVKASFGEGYGGIITFISKQSCPLEESISESVLFTGRDHRICIRGDDHQLIIHNIHNFDLHGLCWDNLCNTVDADITASKADPLHFAFFCTGDFNHAPNSSQLFEYQSPSTTLEPHGPTACQAFADAGTPKVGQTFCSTATFQERPNAAPRPLGGKLLKILDSATEISSSTPTRYQSHTDSGIILDRIFTTLPANVLIQCRVNHSVEQDPKDLYKSGISDHAPVAVSILHKAPLPRGEGAIAPEVTRHPMYAHYLQLLLWDEKLMMWSLQILLRSFSF